MHLQAVQTAQERRELQHRHQAAVPALATLARRLHIPSPRQLLETGPFHDPRQLQEIGPCHMQDRQAAHQHRAGALPHQQIL